MRAGCVWVPPSFPNVAGFPWNPNSPLACIGKFNLAACATAAAAIDVSTMLGPNWVCLLSFLLSCAFTSGCNHKALSLEQIFSTLKGQLCFHCSVCGGC